MSVNVEIPAPEFHHPAELAMIARLRDHGPELIAQYLAKETRNGVSYIARDAAKRIFPEYLANRTENNRYSDRAASALADAARRSILARPVQAERDVVLILTGTPASGKTVASKEATASRLEIVHETIITSPEKIMNSITEALDAGRRPALHLFYTNDPRINVRRMIERARKIGRTVPVQYMATAYVEVPKISALLAAHFGDDLEIFVTNNSWKPGEADQHDNLTQALRDTGAYTKEDCLRCMDDELDQINRRTPIPKDILREAGLR